MSRFFADRDSVEEVHFEEDGVTVWIRKYVDAGIRDDVRNQMVRVNLADSGGKDSQEIREARLQTGDLFMLQKMVTKIQTPDKTFTAPIGMQVLRNMDDRARARLVAVINEYNPLADEEPETRG
jgi:hypothetical protein